MEKGNGFGNDFIRSLLLTLEQTDHKIKSIDSLIKYFESIEEYEKCTNLQKLQSMLYLNTSFNDNDIQKPD